MSAIDRAKKTVATREAKLSATQKRMEARINRATAVVDRANLRVENHAQIFVEKWSGPVDKAKSAIHILKGQLLIARFHLATAKLNAAKETAAKAIAKAETALSKAREALAKALEREAKKAEKTASRAAKKTVSAGTVTTEEGDEASLPKEAAETVKSIIGRKKSGVLCPLDGKEAQKILTAVDKAIGEKTTVGKEFTVKFKGRKTALLFSVEDDGLHFVTV